MCYSVLYNCKATFTDALCVFVICQHLCQTTVLRKLAAKLNKDMGEKPVENYAVAADFTWAPEWTYREQRGPSWHKDIQPEVRSPQLNCRSDSLRINAYSYTCMGLNCVVVYFTVKLSTEVLSNSSIRATNIRNVAKNLTQNSYT